MGPQVNRREHNMSTYMKICIRKHKLCVGQQMKTTTVTIKSQIWKYMSNSASVTPVYDAFFKSCFLLTKTIANPNCKPVLGYRIFWMMYLSSYVQ